ncbi:MAG: hypothetical protein QN172_05050 [Armatimonadota bacterium]|nr:hypothetical protein [Armatimonadota bacterium]MDR7438676.1 hypothetical protein [Armatimonadota bacterium]MDR7563773.1 hypothetical protein [Armatimonadota bacterium]MDR7568897.1 hypothetical protein [Armatimonadota bacterium]MDR7601807.1 hypothetical protein [Armatimonadota bacterium]
MPKRSAKSDVPWRAAAVYAAAVVLLGVAVTVGQIRYEQARRPPPPEVAAKRLVEGMVGEGTVREVRLQAPAVEFQVVLDGVKAVPQDRKRWRAFFADVTKMISEQVFQVLPLLTSGPPELQTVRVRYHLRGREVAVGERKRTQHQANVTLVGP